MSSGPAIWEGVEIYQWQDFDVTLTYYTDSTLATVEPLDDVVEAYMDLRSDADRSAPVLRLSTTPNANGSKLVIGGAAGTVRVYIAPSDTRALDFFRGEFDIFLVWDDGRVEPFVRAENVTITRRVTRR